MNLMLTQTRATDESEQDVSLDNIDGNQENEGSSESTDNREVVAEKIAEKVAQAETQVVLRSKVVVYLVLILAAAVIGTTTYYMAAKHESDVFYSQFHAYSQEVLQVSQSFSDGIFGYMKGLSSKITSFSTSSNLTWPFVTLPNFNIQTSLTIEFSGASMVLFAPVVQNDEVRAWENYSWEHRFWIEQDFVNRKFLGQNDSFPIQLNISSEIYPWNVSANYIPPKVYKNEIGYAIPVWQVAPLPELASIVNIDLETLPSFNKYASEILMTHHGLLSDMFEHNMLHKYAYKMSAQADSSNLHSYVILPVFNDFLAEKSKVTGIVVAVQPWTSYFENIVPPNTAPLTVVVRNTCGSIASFLITGRQSSFLGMGDLHDPSYDSLNQTLEFAARETADWGSRSNVSCDYSVTVYPTAQFEKSYYTNTPALYTAVVCLVFLATVIVFVLHDYIVNKRQDEVLRVAERTNAIVKSLFPQHMQDRMVDAEDDIGCKGGTKWSHLFSPKQQLEQFLGATVDMSKPLLNGESNAVSKPIADFFPETTMMYADIVGFTAWSSMREPAQVFTLLETIYHSFDEIAKQRGVFKVETVGDCYVAVVGLPQPRQDHAVVMARFARDCSMKLQGILKQLVISLGPDTSELGMRFGLHSGPVTAGVLRGDRARFQLFGDTVTTASLIEQTGQRNMVHISKETANLLIGQGKSHWICKRKEQVYVNKEGVGQIELATYWLEITSDRSSVSTGGRSDDAASAHESGQGHETSNDQKSGIDVTKQALHDPYAKERNERLVNWVADVLSSFLRQIAFRRLASKVKPEKEKEMIEVEQARQRKVSTVLDEVVEIITLPKFDASASLVPMPPHEFKLSEAVESQIHSYVDSISHMYKDHPFHNFEHASHVTMSVVKLLSRIVAPDLDHGEINQEDEHVASKLHDHTYGITSDPLTQFAVVFSALIHDVDHPGVPNMQLVKEGSRMAAAYKGKSVAEQNSVDIAWDLLMDSSFKDLRRAIYSNEAEFHRFRQLVVNTVMATDIMDKDLNFLRKARWEKAFSGNLDDDVDVATNRKATIVIEHLIQASDIAHTMQHWHIYRKWNARFFEECHKAYVEGRSDKDPVENWYKGEIGFYDYYIIPLAKKLKDCGVFGVSSDEYLNYAMRNREQWAHQGEELVASMIEGIQHAAAGTS